MSIKFDVLLDTFRSPDTYCNYTRTSDVDILFLLLVLLKDKVPLNLSAIGFTVLCLTQHTWCLSPTLSDTHAHQLTPQRHEDGEENRGRVVKEVRCSGRAAGRAEAPEIARAVAQGTHSEIKTLVAHFLTEEEEAAKKKTRDGGKLESMSRETLKIKTCRNAAATTNTHTRTQTWDFAPLLQIRFFVSVTLPAVLKWMELF